ncbi:MAG: aldehyde dehydrogenase (NADP(+)), partial [Paracoccus sp. (in: a-proteobacteria)]|nr:aldehyde dehydrogenase (NADP(+)) [Paracoccus sp. (in: a-proteobacteria)]
MTQDTHGMHLIAGEWLQGDTSFQSSPATGEPRDYASGSAALVDRAVRAAEDAFAAFAATSRHDRAAFL